MPRKSHMLHAELDALKQNPNAIVKVVRTKSKMRLRLEVTQSKPPEAVPDAMHYPDMTN